MYTIVFLFHYTGCVPETFPLLSWMYALKFNWSHMDVSLGFHWYSISEGHSGSPIYHSCTQSCFLDILWINAVVFSRSFMDEWISVFLSYYWFLPFVFLVLSLMYALVFAWRSTDVGSIYLEMVLIWTAFLLRSLFSALGYDSCISTQRRGSVLNKQVNS